MLMTIATAAGSTAVVVWGCGSNHNNNRIMAIHLVNGVVIN